MSANSSLTVQYDRTKDTFKTSIKALRKECVMKRMQVGNLDMAVGEERFLNRDQIANLTDLVQRWSVAETAIRKKDDVPIWAVRNLGVPTVLCRADIVPFASDEDPSRGLFEIEARPAGFGVLMTMFPHLRSFSECLRPIGPAGTVVLASRKVAAEDTRIFSDVMGWKWLSKRECGNGIPDKVWARGSELDADSGVSLERLEKRGLAPLTNHGDKTYLLDMGLAEPIFDPEDIDWDQPFVVKPQKGSKSDAVLLWHPEEKRKKTGGIYTKTKITKTLKEDRAFIRQHFMFPERERMCSKDGFTIWRIYFLFDARIGEYRFVGGMWNWRPCLKIHGAKDAVMGGILAECH
jgi:hypothetical protein